MPYERGRGVLRKGRVQYTAVGRAPQSMTNPCENLLFL